MKKFLSIITYFFEKSITSTFKKLINKNNQNINNVEPLLKSSNVVITVPDLPNFYETSEFEYDDDNSNNHQISDPLSPFSLNIDWGSESNQKAVAKTYTNQQRPFTQEDHKAIFSELVSFKNFFSIKNTEILEKLWQDAKFVNDGMMILNSLGISYTLDITGGAARDFVLNKDIKDIDFMLSFPNLSGELYKAIQDGLFYKTFSSEELSAVEWTDPIINNRSNVQDVHKKQLAQLCLNRQKCINEVYFFKDNRNLQVGEETGYSGLSTNKPIYKEDRLISVIKLSNDDLHYPCDILLTDFIKPVFLEEFDFDLCKASFSFVNHYYQTTFPEKSSHLISRFIADRDFYADAHNKTITYNSSNKSEYEIKSTFSKHYKNILHKFNEYEFNLTGNGHYHELARSAQQRALLEIELQKNLPMNSDKPKKVNKV